MVFMSQKMFVFLLFVTILFSSLKFEQVFCAKSVLFAQSEDYFQHTVRQGETVYSLSKMYGIPLEDIYHLNPKSEIGIKVGTQLKIPSKSDLFFYHIIQSKETLYSVSQKYRVKEEDILEVNPKLSIETFTTGKTICIPVSKRDTCINESQGVHMVKVALLLPFGLKDRTYKNIRGRHMLEYYEGLLVALRDIKANGISVSLQVFDIGSEISSLQSIFNNPCIQSVNLIIGGVTGKQIKLISDFSDKYNIPYVIPFTSKCDEPLFHSNTYQINTPQPYLYSRVSAAFCSKYKDANIIFYSPNFSGNKMDFVDIVQKDLKLREIAYKVIGDSNPAYSDVIKVLDGNKNNVFVLSDDGQDILAKLICLLKIKKESRTYFSISLFGYPAWQVYGMKQTSDFFRFNVVFYSIFYADFTSQKVKSFCNSYRYWYSKNLINSYPRYGMLGYDMGMFFIQLLNKYGISLAENINKSDYLGIQTSFYFERLNNYSGFINTNLYWVEFNKDFTISSHRILVK
ncbi:conserved hypothetical protein [Candidatus Azobacteroides pseudotrichonymphae genomovar. CFP2]|uniref:LysM domain-containing protein n=2 Tax=Candidatus Azobacteroides TaxID=511434 RepID=B6YRB6_AZOPC|nr:conserved hypothetical protein [Candidatus Azobacteroides pseudotrichonymphae genomovar. CFP2]